MTTSEGECIGYVGFLFVTQCPRASERCDKRTRHGSTTAPILKPLCLNTHS